MLIPSAVLSYYEVDKKQIIVFNDVVYCHCENEPFTVHQSLTVSVLASKMHGGKNSFIVAPGYQVVKV